MARGKLSVSLTVSRARLGEGAAAATRLIAGLLGTFLVILLMAGFPLLLSPAGSGLALSPRRIVEAMLGFFHSLGDGSVFIYLVGLQQWDFRDLAPGFLLQSFMYTALPGAVGIGLGSFLGVALQGSRLRKLDRLAETALALPDFLLIFALESAAVWAVTALGLRISFDHSGGRLAFLPLFAMSFFPFFLAYRSAAQAASKAREAEYIRCARSRGLSERDIAWRHLGAVVLPRIESDLPLIMAFMQGNLFITEKLLGIPGMARFLFDTAFAGRRRVLVREVYQYNAVVLSLVSIVATCALVYVVLRLCLALVRKVLTRE
jgi:hypothetical protein